MPITDERVDTYIENSADFARPILQHLRQLVHAAIPDVKETIKWGMPHFETNGVICHMASFKQHCAFGFWKADRLSDKHQVLQTMGKSGMSSFGHIKSPADLPDDAILTEYLKEAAHLNKSGIKSAAKEKPTEKKELEVPGFLYDALQENEAARQTFENFSPSNRKDYITWLSEAKTDATREKRLETALEWMAEGKTRHWKYIKK